MNLRAHLSRSFAFSLIELLLVMTIITVMMVSSSIVTSSVQRSSEISRDTTLLADQLSRASLESIRINRPIIFRFYRFTDPDVDPEPLVQGYQMLTLNPKTGRYVPYDKIRRLTYGIAIHPDSQASTILSLPETTPTLGSEDDSLDTVSDPVLDTISPYTYFEFEFRPDGSTNLPKDRAWGVVIAFHAESLATEGVPKNFRSLSVNPFTGAVRNY